MKIAVIITRILMGALFIMSSVVVLFNLVPVPELQGANKTFNEGLAAAGYLVPMLKVFELLVGLAFLVNRFMALACVVAFPITLNILVYHMVLAPEGLAVGILLFAGNLFLAYQYRTRYQPVLALK
jgi:putative oxidoreductase